MKKSFPKLLAIAALILLLTHPSLSLEGARNGLLLWYQTVLPTLLPFMICSNVIVSLNAIPLLTAPLRPVLGRILGLSDAGTYVLVSGLLCGYPMGAKTCSEFVKEGRISPAEGRCLLAFTNHPSPMFLLGYMASALDPCVPLSLVLTALYLPVLPLAFLARSLCHPHSGKFPVFGTPKEGARRTFDESMMSSFEIMVKIGGYMMLFSILARFIGQISGLPSPVQALLLGITEITVGIQAVSHTFHGTAQGMALCFIAAFGGICGLFQTTSVLTDGKLSPKAYFFWKLLHAGLSLAVFTVMIAVWKL